METVNVVLFLHIFVVLCAFTLAGALHTSEWVSVRSTTVQELRLVTRPQKYGFLFGPIVLLLLGLGLWLVHLHTHATERYSVGDGFIWTAMLTLLVLFVGGPLVMGRHATAMLKALAEAPDGPVTPELRRMSGNPTVWMLGHAYTLMVVAVVFNMANKPAVGVCVSDIVLGALLGVLLGRVGSQKVLAQAG